jgi:hypothetical protein
MAHRDRYRSYGELAAAHREGIDFRVQVVQRGSGVAIIAPHGGRIERGTSEIARAIAGEDFDLYLFEGCLPSRNFETLHLTSHHFDEPRCLSMISGCHTVVAITAWPMGGNWPCWADGMLCWRVRWPIACIPAACEPGFPGIATRGAMRAIHATAAKRLRVCRSS